ncbi:tetratricopeptide repeat protein 12-like [Arctopsyche grandis]|uniref:tetratricopeptide repeat protein 12-like n=1 Tax=Arctopsyche grandis TaxID=121162 RepID=UPI00406D9427
MDINGQQRTKTLHLQRIMDNNEEFNNFMHKVTEISAIVNGLVSEDKETSENAQQLADIYLQEKNNLDTDGKIDIKLKCDRTVINKTNYSNEGDKKTNPNEMDPEMFMKQMSIDAEKRSADKKVRMEKADTLKTQASRAFKRGEYELALSRYNKAIDQIRDSCLLYTNRALTLLKLKEYDKVLSDCDWALKLNDNSFKARIYRAKAYQGLRNRLQYLKCYEGLLQTHPHRKELIDDFLKDNGED